MTADKPRLCDALLAQGHALTGDRRLTSEAYRHALLIACGIIEGLTDPDPTIRELQMRMFLAQRAKETATTEQGESA